MRGKHTTSDRPCLGSSVAGASLPLRTWLLLTVERTSHFQPQRDAVPEVGRLLPLHPHRPPSAGTDPRPCASRARGPARGSPSEASGPRGGAPCARTRREAPPRSRGSRMAPSIGAPMRCVPAFRPAFHPCVPCLGSGAAFRRSVPCLGTVPGYRAGVLARIGPNQRYITDKPTPTRMPVS